MTRDDPLFKILHAEELASLILSGEFAGSKDDLRDGFLHLSTDTQMVGTLEKHFASANNIFALRCGPSVLGPDLKWEVSRGGDYFPHLYRPLRIADVAAIAPLPGNRWPPAQFID